MTPRTFETPCGPIRYWVDHTGSRPPLVFLPGLTADHRLFREQLRRFRGDHPVLVWDPPGHAASRPFRLTFTLLDQARWLDELLTGEGLDRPILVGQSMGGYVGQAYAQLYPDRLQGFISIDSAPLQRRYMTGWELWVLKRMEPVYRWTPWRLLLRWGSTGVSETDEGRALMREMMETYDGDRRWYAALAGHGFRMLAEAVEADLPYRLCCPALLICGQRDHAGSCVRYDRAWARHTGLRLAWLKGAGHNANTDRPAAVNALIRMLLDQLPGDAAWAPAGLTADETATLEREVIWEHEIKSTK